MCLLTRNSQRILQLMIAKTQADSPAARGGGMHVELREGKWGLASTAGDRQLK